MFSLFAKAGTHDQLALRMAFIGADATTDAFFDLSNGTAGTVKGPTGVESGIIAYPDGWYRCWVNSNSATIDTNYQLRATMAEADNVLTIITRNGKNIYVANAMLEDKPTGTLPSTFIPNTTAGSKSASAHLTGKLPSLDSAILTPSDRTNRIYRSEDFSHASWGTLNLVATAGELTADAGTHIARINQTAASFQRVIGEVVSHTLKVKAGTHDYVWFGDRGSIPATSMTIDLSDGSIVGTSNLSSSSVLGPDADGYYTVRMTYIRGNAGNVSMNIAFGDASHTVDWPTLVLGGTETLLVKEAQITERGVSPYIGPTAGAAVTDSEVVLQGHAPTVVTASGEAPPAGSLSLTGQAPTLVTTGAISRTPAAGALVLAGDAPLYGFGELPSAAALSFTGNTFTLRLTFDSYLSSRRKLVRITARRRIKHLFRR